MISFSLKIPQKDLNDYIHHELKDHIAKACRMGLNRAVTGAKTDAAEVLPQVFNTKRISASRIKQDFISPVKASGLNLESMEAKARIRSHRGISLIRFALAVRKQKQKRVPVQGRASAQYVIKKGRSENNKGSFIVSAKKGTATSVSSKLIFRAKRGVYGQGRLASQYGPSVAVMLQDEDVVERYEEKLNERLIKEIDQAMAYELSRL